MRNLIGLPEFRVLDVLEDSDGKSLTICVENENPPKDCPACLIRKPMRSHQKEERIVQDLNVSGKLVYLNIIQRRYKCPDCGTTFNEIIDCVDGRNRMTDRLRDDIKHRCLMDTFTRITKEYSITKPTVREIFDEFVRENERDLIFDAPEVLGLDEAHLAKKMRAVITDIKGRKLLDILPNRDTQPLIQYFKAMRNRKNVEVVTIDMYKQYRKVAHESFFKPIVVIDKYHVVQLITKALDQERINIGKSLTDAEDKKALRKCKDILASNESKLTSEQKAQLAEWFKRFPRLAKAYRQKENFLQMYAAPSRQAAEKMLAHWCHDVPDGFPCFSTARDTFAWWAHEITNYFDVRYTNAYTERVNGFIKELQIAGKGYTFEVLRVKALFTSHEPPLIRFRRADASYHASTSFQKMWGGDDSGFYYPDIPFVDNGDELIDGWGVDIDEVMEYMKSPEW